MSTPIPQITVLVSIVTDSHNETHAYYSWQPPGAAPVFNMPAFVIAAPTPYETLFALDYDSSKQGWSFFGVLPVREYTAPQYSIADNNLSLTTHITGDTTYKFLLGFQNGDQKFYDDPQEGNGPAPKTIAA